MNLKYHILTLLAALQIALQIASLSNAAQQPLNTIPKSTATNATTVIREGVNAELAKQQTMNTELYSLTASGLPPCNNAGDVRQWDGDSWECTPVIDFSATSPLNFNSTTGVLSLTPWASQSALETWLGWSFPKNNEGVVSASTTTATGNINIDGVSADHYYFNNGSSAATYTPVITSPPSSGKERGIILTVGGGAGVCTMTWTNVSWIGNSGAGATTANKYSHYLCFIPSSGNARCKIIAEASDN